MKPVECGTGVRDGVQDSPSSEPKSGKVELSKRSD